jgi:hypothetical protein
VSGLSATRRTGAALPRSQEVLVLYWGRSGDGSCGTAGIFEPERFRYSDLKEAVWKLRAMRFESR